MSMSIAKKNIFAFSFMTFLLIILGITGYSGAQKLSAVLTFLTTKAWPAADGAMEGTIGLQAQIIDVINLTDPHTPKNEIAMYYSALQNSKEFTDSALGEMRESGLIPEADLNQLDLRLQQFESAKSAALKIHKDILAGTLEKEILLDNLDQFKKTYTELLKFMEQLEEIGDSQVENQMSTIVSIQKFTNNSIILVCIIAISFSIIAGYMSIRLIVTPIKEVAKNMRRIAEEDGDLTVKLDARGNDELAQLASAFNLFVEKIHHTIVNVAGSSKVVTESGNTLASLTQHTSLALQQQFTETSSVASAVNQMTASISEVAHNASIAASATTNAKSEVDNGSNTINQTLILVNDLSSQMNSSTTVINALYSDTETIGSILDVIRGIAEQTNLLALNAAIEAARAGEQGRGFAVVADEVRTLATRTQTSTEEIHQMIEKLQTGAQLAVKSIESSQKLTDESVSKVSEAKQNFAEILTIIDQLNNMNTQVSVATEQQTSVSDEVNKNITNINHAAEEVNQHVQEIIDTSQLLSLQSEQLSVQVNQFKV